MSGNRTTTRAEHHYANARWLLKLRWVAVIGQLATIGGSIWLFQAQIPMAWAMGVVISLTVVSNLFLMFWFQRWQQIDRFLEQDPSPLPWNLVLGLVLIMDMLSLTALLFTTGGPNNPFCLFFFVNLSLSALLLNRAGAWAVNVLTILCFGLLMFEHYSIIQLDMGLNRLRGHQIVSLNHLGLFVAFATCSSVIVYFMTRLTDELRLQQAEVRRAQQLQANAEKIEALGTLAAGTAHELATPLSTIAIVARDVEQAFEEHPPQFPGAQEVIEDVHLIRSQLERCRRIIDRMSSHAGETIGESITETSIADLATLILDGLLERDRVQLKLSPSAATGCLRVPPEAVAQAFRGLVQNAIDADPSGKPVLIEVAPQQEGWLWTIRDQGEGMTAQQLARISEPFFTTKPPGKGMGLGVFLAQNVIRRLEGRIDFASRPGQGTIVSVWLPRSTASTRESGR